MIRSMLANRSMVYIVSNVNVTCSSLMKVNIAFQMPTLFRQSSAWLSLMQKASDGTLVVHSFAINWHYPR